jgi:hypothetical protein
LRFSFQLLYKTVPNNTTKKSIVYFHIVVNGGIFLRAYNIKKHIHTITPVVISCGVITFILYLNLHPQFRPNKKNLLHKVVLHSLVKTTLRSIYFVDKKEVEWRRKKQGGSHHIYTIQTPNDTYHHPKSRSIGSTNSRSSLHCVVLHTCVTKNYYYLCAKKRVICAF